MKSNVIKLNTLRLNSANLNVVGEEQNLSLSAGGDPEQPPVEPPVVPVTYTLSASASNGVVSASVNGKAVTLPYTANEGDVVVVEVTANDGYEFEGWNDGSTDNPRSITMTADVTLSATCVEQVVESKYIQFEDAEVERVLMSKGVSSDGVGITIEDAEKVTSISSWFRANTAVVSFNELGIFKNVKELGGSSFYRCTNLRSVDTRNITKIGTYAFSGCSLLQMPNLNYVTDISTEVFNDCGNLSGELDVPVLVGGGSRAFRQTKISAVRAPKIQQVGGSFAYNCKSLERVELGPDCVLIDAFAFGECSALATFICRATTPPTLGNVNAFTNTNNCPIYVPDASVEAYRTATNWSTYADRIHPLSEIEGSPYITFADPAVEAICVANWSSDGIGLTKEDAAAVTNISGKFNNNTEIVSFDELEYFTGLTIINESSFYNCSNMKSLRLPKNITQVKPYAFYNCTAAFEIDLPNLTMASSGNGREFTPSGVVAVKNMGSIPKVPSFASCKSLRYAILPVTATNVSSSAFYQCTALEALVFKNPIPATIGDNYAFTGTSCNVYVPDASVADYQAATRWTSISSRIKGISSLATDNPTLLEEIKDYLS